MISTDGPELTEFRKRSPAWTNRIEWQTELDVPYMGRIIKALYFPLSVFGEDPY